MACNTRSRSKFKDVLIDNGSHSGSSASDANQHNRSARKASLKVISITSGTRKSGRLLKMMTTPTNTERSKFVRSKKGKMVTHMMTPKRIKEHSTLMAENTADACKIDSFRFVEYWLPVQISEVQLEQYCSALVTNASVLQSSSKSDSIEALQRLLTSTRQCCNHPYVVKPSLQTLLTKGLRAVDFLEVGIKASGKLHVLDSMLLELKKRGLRVLILFQSGPGKDSIGDILDDFLLQRFGSDAYERVDKGVLHSKKLDALTQFNNNESGKFIFLLDACVCFPSIKLSSVDIVIIFNSDWNPMNDIRSLQRLTLDSQSEQIKIFRLYSCFTVEEKTLILAKQGKLLESNLPNLSWSMSHMLLMWGSSFLFDNLRLIHDGESSSPCSSYSFENPGQLSKEVLHEFSSLLLQDSGCNDTSSCSIILNVQLNEGRYCTKFALLGEKKLGSPGEGLPNLFWTELLKGKVPQSKDSCDSSQRTRRRAHHDGGSLNALDFEREERARKHRKVMDIVLYEPTSHFQIEKSSTGNEEGNKAEYGKRKPCEEQRSLHLLMMPQIAKLCEILHFPDNVKTLVYNMLECIMNCHHISRESNSILQAFQISLCWTAASLLKHKINHKVSLMLAREHLKFGCEKEEAEYMYLRLRCLKKILFYRAENSNAIGVSKPSESTNKVYSCTRVAPEVDSIKKDIAKSIKEIQKNCQKKLRKLLLRQGQEKNKLNQANDEMKAYLMGKYKIESAVIRYCYSNDAVRSEKLKILDKEFSTRIEDLECQHGIQLKELEALQLEASQKFQRREATWIEEVNSWAQEELNIFLSNEFVSGLKYSHIIDQTQPQDDSKNADIVSDHVDEGPIAASYGGSISRNDGCNKAESVYEIQRHIASTLSHSKKHNYNDASAGAYESDGQNDYIHSSSDDTVNLVLPSSEGKMCDGKTLDASIQVITEVDNADTLDDGRDEFPSTREGDLWKTVSSNPDCCFSLGSKTGDSGDGMGTSLNSQSSPDPMPSATAVCMPNCDDTVQIHETNESSGLDRLATFSSPSSEDRTAYVAPGVLSESELPGEISLQPIGTASPSRGSDIIYENNSLSPEQQTLGKISTEVLENSQGVNECYNDKDNQIKAIMLNTIASSDQQGGISGTINEDSMSMEIQLSCSHSEQPFVISSPVAAVNEVPQNLCTSPFASHKTADDDVEVGEVQNSSQQAEQLSSPVDHVAIQSNPTSLVMDTTVKVQQLSPAEFHVGNQDATEEVQTASRQAESMSTSFSSIPVTLTNPDSLPRNSLEQGQISHSPESPVSNRDLAEEVQKFSHPIDVVPPNQSNCESLVVEPLMQDQQLPALESSSSKQDTVEEMLNPSPQDDGQVMANQDLGNGLLSVEQPSSNENPVEELQSSSQQIISVCSPVDCTPQAQANSETLVMEPLEHAEQLVSVDVPSSSWHTANLPVAPTTEDQQISEVNVCSQVPQAIIDEVLNLVVMQPDSMSPIGGRTHWSNIIDSSPPENGSQAIQNATESASMMPPPFYIDPLELEMERIRNVTCQAVKDHENMKLQLKSDRDKEMNEIISKYNSKIQEIEVEHRQKQKDLDENMKKTAATMDLAQVMNAKWWGPPLIDKNFAQQHLQLHGERSGFRSSLGAGPSTWVPPATTPQSGFPMARSQPMMTPIQSPYITTRNLSNVYATPPQVGNIQHSLASYPQLYRPSTSMSTNSYSVLVRGISNRLIPINIPPTSTLYPHLSPQPTPPTYLVDPRLSLNGIHISHLMDVANQFGFNSQNFRPNM